MIEVNSNALFLSTFGVKIDVKNERKRVSRMCENSYLSIKNLKASWTLAADCLLHSCDSTSLHQQLSASEAGPPLDQILDPHLNVISWDRNS